MIAIATVMFKILWTNMVTEKEEEEDILERVVEIVMMTVIMNEREITEREEVIADTVMTVIVSMNKKKGEKVGRDIIVTNMMNMMIVTEIDIEIKVMNRIWIDPNVAEIAMREIEIAIEKRIVTTEIEEGLTMMVMMMMAGLLSEGEVAEEDIAQMKNKTVMLHQGMEKDNQVRKMLDQRNDLLNLLLHPFHHHHHHPTLKKMLSKRTI